MKLFKSLILCTLITTVHIDAARYETAETQFINLVANKLSLSTSKIIIASLLSLFSGAYISSYYLRHKKYNEMHYVERKHSIKISDNKPVESVCFPIIAGLSSLGLIALVDSIDESASPDTQDTLKQFAAIPLYGCVTYAIGMTVLFVCEKLSNAYEAITKKSSARDILKV